MTDKLKANNDVGILMEKNGSGRKHVFQFPGSTGSLTLSVSDDCFPDISSDELFTIGKIIRDFLYGVMLEEKEQRSNFINIFYSVLKDSSLLLEEKDLETLLRFSGRLFHQGDYANSLFLSKYLLARINTIIDDKIAHNSHRIDKETIQLQISTLNFIGYLFAKMEMNIDYGIKLVYIANTLLDEFDVNNTEIQSLRAAVLDTLGALHIEKGEWSTAIEHLTRAHELDTILLSAGQVDAVGFRLTCSNLGFALVNWCNELLDKNNGSINIHGIEDALRQSRLLFNMVRVDQPPMVPEKDIKNLELLTSIKRMKKGIQIGEDVRIRLQRRLI